MSSFELSFVLAPLLFLLLESDLSSLTSLLALELFSEEDSLGMLLSLELLDVFDSLLFRDLLPLDLASSTSSFDLLLLLERLLDGDLSLSFMDSLISTDRPSEDRTNQSPLLLLDRLSLSRDSLFLPSFDSVMELECLFLFVSSIK